MKKITTLKEDRPPKPKKKHSAGLKYATILQIPWQSLSIMLKIQVCSSWWARAHQSAIKEECRNQGNCTVVNMKVNMRNC